MEIIFSMKINKSQKKISAIFASIIALMLIFPPYKIYGFGASSQAVLETGYSLIFELPMRASIDGVTLVVQWIGVCLVGALIFKIFDDDESIR
jgi:hypothetical protein